MPLSLREQVRERAGRRCDYCLLPEESDCLPFQLDHIIAEKHHGPTLLENLAWSCCNCNASKGPNIAGLDLETGALTRLFHPRKDAWADHFGWNGALLIGLTPVGRVTVDVLNVNQTDRVAHRVVLLQAKALETG
jgi:hypothetical protein